jgi:hypothetical protein
LVIANGVELMMQFAGINHWGVVAAGLAAFVFGALWYGTLSSAWLSALGKSEQEIKASSPAWRLYAVTLVAETVMAWILAGMIGHLGPGQVTIRNGVISGAFAWFGFVLTTLIVNHSFQARSPKLTLIDAGHWLGVLLLQGAVVGLIGV